MSSQLQSLETSFVQEFLYDSSMLAKKKLFLSRPETCQMEDYFKIKFCPEKTVIYREGRTCKNVYFIASGRVRLKALVVEEQRDSLIEILGPGDFFGNLSDMDPTQMKESAIAAPETEIWSIESNIFQTLINTRPQLAQEIFQAQQERLCQQQRRLFWLTTREIPMRLNFALIDLSERFGEPSPKTGECVLMGISQLDLAEYVGSVRSFISRIVGDLRRAGIVTLLNRTLYIQNRRRLYEITGLPVPSFLD